MTPLTVVAEIVAKPGREEELRRRLLALIEPTRKEEGCLQYDLHADNDAPGRFLFYENWTSEELLERHLAAPHLEEFKAVAGELLAEPLRILRMTRIG